MVSLWAEGLQAWGSLGTGPGAWWPRAAGAATSPPTGCSLRTSGLILKVHTWGGLLRDHCIRLRDMCGCWLGQTRPEWVWVEVGEAPQPGADTGTGAPQGNRKNEWRRLQGPVTGRQHPKS